MTSRTSLRRESGAGDTDISPAGYGHLLSQQPRRFRLRGRNPNHQISEEDVMKRIVHSVLILASLTASGTVFAEDDAQSNACSSLPGHSALKTALKAAVAAETSGLNFDMWATIVDRDGVVCAVAFSGANRGSQWPGS